MLLRFLFFVSKVFIFSLIIFITLFCISYNSFFFNVLLILFLLSLGKILILQSNFVSFPNLITLYHLLYYVLYYYFIYPFLLCPRPRLWLLLWKKKRSKSLLHHFFFLIGVQLLYNVVLVSVVQCIESVMYIHISPPSWASLPPQPYPNRVLCDNPEDQAEIPVLYTTATH